MACSMKEKTEMTDTEFKVYENRIRRAAARQGLRLVKSRRRDPRAYDYQKYWLFDSQSGNVDYGDQTGFCLADVEAYLNRP